MLLPEEAYRVLVRVVEAMREGKAVAVVSRTPDACVHAQVSLADTFVLPAGPTVNSADATSCVTF